MIFAVTWHLEAVLLLERLIAEAEDPDRIRKAAEWMDWSLRRHPLDLGESRNHPGERLWYEDVLGLYYEADREAMTVRVISVGLARRA